MNNVSHAASLKCNFCENVELCQVSSLCLFNFPHCFLQQILQRQWKCIRCFQFIWVALILCYWTYSETKTIAETASALKNFYPMITSSKKIPKLPSSLEQKMVLMNLFFEIISNIDLKVKIFGCKFFVFRSDDPMSVWEMKFVQ